MLIHEQTQRFILLLIFYLFGPMLTLGIIGGVVVRKLPSNARSWERYLIQATGLHWTIQSVEFCSPGFIRLKSVQIKDDITQHVIFNARTIDAQLIAETRLEKNFPGMTSSATQKSTGLTGLVFSLFPSLDSTNTFWQISIPESYLDFREYPNEDSALLVQNMLRKLVARFPTLSEVPVRFVFDEIAVASEYSLKKGGNEIADKVDIFRFVQGNIYRTPSEVRSDWSFQIKDISEFDTVHLSFTLSLVDSLQISFRTGRQPIPCDLAAVFCPLFKHFSGGTFLGKFTLSTSNRSNVSTIQLSEVVFSDVPLAPLVRPYTDFAVEGMVADLRLKQAVFGTEETYAEGNFIVVDGAVERALFLRCADNFQLTVYPDETLPDSPMIPFTACSIHFRLKPKEIDFWADQTWRDALMYYQKENLAFGVYFPANRRPVTYHELMSIFATDGSPVVPLTSRLKPLMAVLPTP